MVIAICDDDQLFLRKLHKTILGSSILNEQIKEDIHVIHYHNKEEIIAKYSTDGIEAVFMDIEFGSDIGFDVARELIQIDSDLLIVYMTNYDHYVYQSFVCRPMGFVRKSNMEQDITLALTQVVEEIEKRNKIISIPVKGGGYEVKLAKVYAIEMQNHCMEILFHGENIVLKSSLNKIESELIEHGFLKARRGIMVNPEFIANIDSEGMIEMRNGKRYPVSRDNLTAIHKKWLLAKAM